MDFNSIKDQAKEKGKDFVDNKADELQRDIKNRFGSKSTEIQDGKAEPIVEESSVEADEDIAGNDDELVEAEQVDTNNVEDEDESETTVDSEDKEEAA